MDIMVMKPLSLILVIFLFLANCVTMETQTYEKCIDGNCEKGRGVKQFGNGVYVGEFKEGKPEGQGVITYWQGHKFVGQFKNGRILGEGKFIHSDGNVEAGIWKQSEKSFTSWYYGIATEEAAERRQAENFSLLVAAYSGDALKAEELLKSPLHVPGLEESTGNTMLLIAAKQYNIRNLERNFDKVIDLFVLYRAKNVINQPNRDGQTPLMYAAANCPARIVKLLIANGADVNYGNNVRHWLWGHLDQRPLTWAIRYNREGNRDEVIAILKAAGAHE